MNQRYLTYIFGGLLALVIILLIIPVEPKEGRRSGPKIIIFGDSLVAGYNISREDAFPAKLQKAFIEQEIEVNIIGAGVSGETTAGGLKRLSSIIEQKPVAVIVELGANDMLNSINPDVTKTNLDKILGKLQGANIKVFFVGMRAAPNLDANYQNTFNRIYPDLAQKYQTGFYPFFLDGVIGQSEFLLPDGVHPNEKGVEEMVRRIFPYVNEFVGTLQ